jgi:diadenylate cyclase
MPGRTQLSKKEVELFEIGFVPIRLVDIFDISLVTFLLYRLYQVLKGSLALRLLWLILVIFLVWRVVDLLDMVLLKAILDQFLGLGAVVLVIIFAPELRKFLTVISRNTLLDRFARQMTAKVESDELSEEIEAALKDIRATGNGALIVLTGLNPLSEIQETGDRLNAEVSARLIYTIFQKQSPLHDGAMIIHNNKIVAVRCILPISKSQEIPAEMGMRHRAAMGIAEQSDALIIVVSEERREISVAYNGELIRDVDYVRMEKEIQKHYQRSVGEQETA